jgi:hypothetical protein
MEVHVRMLQQERADRLGLMRREVVGDYVNLPPLGLTGHDVAEEFDKRSAGVRATVCASTSPDFVSRAAKSDSAVAVILEPVALAAPGRERQHGIQMVERMNGLFSSPRRRRHGRAD